MKHLLVVAFLATSLLILANQSSSQRICSCLRPGRVCTADWKPVCGIKDGRICTFSNRCQLDKCQFLHNGVCRH